MKKIFLIGILFSFLYSCQDEPVGYLITDYAHFSPDSLVVHKDLKLEPTIETVLKEEYQIWLTFGYTVEQILEYYPDALETIETEGEHYERYTKNIPWVSYPVQGIDGTYPFFYKIVKIEKAGGGDITEIASKSRVRGDGTIEVDIINDIEIGEYLFYIEVRNEDFSSMIPKPLRVVVK